MKEDWISPDFSAYKKEAGGKMHKDAWGRISNLNEALEKKGER